MKQGSKQGRTKFIAFVKPIFWTTALIGTVILGNFLETTVIGLAAFVFFMFYALLFRVSSVATFQLSLIALLGTFLTSALYGESSLPETFAVYAYVLLAIGVLFTCIEQWQDVHAPLPKAEPGAFAPIARKPTPPKQTALYSPPTVSAPSANRHASTKSVRNQTFHAKKG